MTSKTNSINITTTNAISDNFSKSINSIRAIAIIFIIFSHSSSLVFSLNLDGNFYFSMGALGVGIFTFLSGVLLTRSLLIKNEINHSWIKWYKRRIVRIFPLLVLSTLFILFYKFILFNTTYDLNSILIHLSGLQAIPTNPNSMLIMEPHWFITFILSCYLIFPLLFYFLKNNFKLTLIIGITCYLLFFIFSAEFYNAVEFFFTFYLGKEFNKNFFRGYFPCFFTFFFGMVLGYKLGENGSIEYLNNNRKVKVVTFVVLLSLCMLVIYLIEICEFSIFFRYSFLYSILLFPSIVISLTIFCIIYLEGKNRINKFFKVLGNHSYEIFLIHLFPIALLALLEIELELYFIYILIAIISCIVISHPFYYARNWINNTRKYHNSIVTISLSLMIYALIIYTLQLETDFNNFGAFVLFFSILIIITITIILRQKFSNNKNS